MTILILDNDPKKIAEMLDDKCIEARTPFEALELAEINFVKFGPKTFNEPLYKVSGVHAMEKENANQ